MTPGESWASVGASRLAQRLREQTRCGDPSSATTTGLVAYLAGEPVGWCALEPRSAYPRPERAARATLAGTAVADRDGERVARHLETKLAAVTSGFA